MISSHMDAGNQTWVFWKSSHLNHWTIISSSSLGLNTESWPSWRFIFKVAKWHFLREKKWTSENLVQMKLFTFYITLFHPPSKFFPWNLCWVQLLWSGSTKNDRINIFLCSILLLSLIFLKCVCAYMHTLHMNRCPWSSKEENNGIAWEEL